MHKGEHKELDSNQNLEYFVKPLALFAVKIPPIGYLAKPLPVKFFPLFNPLKRLC
jgi:hypothetical protein